MEYIFLIRQVKVVHDCSIWSTKVQIKFCSFAVKCTKSAQRLKANGAHIFSHFTYLLISCARSFPFRFISLHLCGLFDYLFIFVLFLRSFVHSIPLLLDLCVSRWLSVSRQSKWIKFWATQTALCINVAPRTNGTNSPFPFIGKVFLFETSFSFRQTTELSHKSIYRCTAKE